jgi:exopolyphosphatase / guanosine-5'-triphosphate,3'-diphosphate pyrophosphatase
MIQRVAAIDFGTNTARLLIADLSADGCFEQVFLERKIVRMGGDFCRESGLSRQAIERGLLCLKSFSEAIAEYKASTVRAVATSAVRDARNGADFVRMINRETGICLKVIDGTTEAEITMAGVLCGLDQPSDEIIIFDIGGGSTEYTLVKNGRILYSRSLPLGVVRLTEGKVTVEAMQQKIRKELDCLQQDLSKCGFEVSAESVLIGTAGTATTLAAINMKMVEYDYRKVNNSLITDLEIMDIFNTLLPLSLHDRVKVPGLEKGREDLIIAGILLTVQTMELFKKKTMKVSDYGLLEGLVVSASVPLDCRE